MAGKVSFSLNPNPTFKATVHIPIPGDGDQTQPLEFTFKHKNRTEFAKFMQALDDVKFVDKEVTSIDTDAKVQEGLDIDVGFVMEIAEGWALSDEFTKENVTLLLQNYFGASNVIVSTYVDSLLAAKTKN